MQWHQNKIQISSVLYFCFLVLMLITIGSWHNLLLPDSNENVWLVNILLIISILLATGLYLMIIVKPGSDAKESAILKTNEIQKTDEQKETIETKIEETFDKSTFISGILPEKKLDLNVFCETILKNLAGKLQGVQGIFYLRSEEDNVFRSQATYAFYSNEAPAEFKSGETISGQAVKDLKVLVIQNIPEDYIRVVSGLGNGNPKCILMIPVIYKNEGIGLIEMATFKPVDSLQESALKEISGIIGENITKLTK